MKTSVDGAADLCNAWLINHPPFHIIHHTYCNVKSPGKKSKSTIHTPHTLFNGWSSNIVAVLGTALGKNFGKFSGRHLCPETWFKTQGHQRMNRRRAKSQPKLVRSIHIGLSLNGFYLATSNRPKSYSNTISNNNATKIEPLFCAFKPPEGTFNSYLVEKRTFLSVFYNSTWRGIRTLMPKT